MLTWIVENFQTSHIISNQCDILEISSLKTKKNSQTTVREEILMAWNFWILDWDTAVATLKSKRAVFYIYYSPFWLNFFKKLYNIIIFLKKGHFFMEITRIRVGSLILNAPRFDSEIWNVRNQNTVKSAFQNLKIWKKEMWN